MKDVAQILLPSSCVRAPREAVWGKHNQYTRLFQAKLGLAEDVTQCECISRRPFSGGLRDTYLEAFRVQIFLVFCEKLIHSYQIFRNRP